MNHSFDNPFRIFNSLKGFCQPKNIKAKYFENLDKTN